MSEHARIRDLIGPYLIEGLDRDESREVEDHLRRCVACQRETQDLSRVHERMSELAEAVEAPPPGLKSRVMHTLPDRRRRMLSLSAAAVFLVAVAIAAILYASGVFVQEPIASASLSPTSHAPEAGGEIQLYETNSNNIEVHIETWGLPKCERGEYYQVWFAEGDERISGGTFTIGPDGRAEMDLSAARLATNYTQVGVASETARKAPGSTGKKVLGGKLGSL